MTALHIVLTVVQCILAVGLVFIVTLQTGKSAGLSSTIAGNSETYLGKNKGKSRDKTLAKATKWVAAAFIILTFVLNLF